MFAGPSGVGVGMTEPAKDEAALLARITGALWNYQGAHHADIALAAIRAAGWAVVPVEPTEEMFDAGHAASAHGNGIVASYRAMLAAAPGVKP